MSKKILIVDDDEEICAELSAIIKAEGYRVETVFDGARALALLAQKRYHLVLLDLKLPKVTGFEVIRNLRQAKAPVKILVVTGRPLQKKSHNLPSSAFEAEEERTLALADAIINKPFDIEALLSRIRSLAH